MWNGTEAAPPSSHAISNCQIEKILISDVPPRITRKSEPELVIAGIGILCGSVMIAAMLFVFLGA
jgi:hypothetical protein